MSTFRSCLYQLVSTFVLEPVHELRHRPPMQIPALDALRTSAILFVVAGHVSAVHLEDGGTNNLFAALPFVRAGWIGVDLFFVLSGYFIGSQLWKELLRTGSVDFWKFFFRRGLRIWPLFAFFIMMVAILNPSYVFGQGRWSDPVFLTNYFNRGIVKGGWSLCSEEQFYIIAPLLLIATRRRDTTLAAYRPYLVAGLILMPVLRGVTWWYLTGDLWAEDHRLYYKVARPLHTHADGLIFGMLIANYAVAFPKVSDRPFAKAWVPVVATVIAVGMQILQKQTLHFTAVTLIFSASCWWLLCSPRLFARVTDSWWFYLVSRLSFGMYLNHQYFQHDVVEMFVSRQWLSQSPTLQVFAAFVCVTGMSMCAATVTYCIVEYPFLKLRERVFSKRGVQHVFDCDANRLEGKDIVPKAEPRIVTS
jgi:peptidoglycan/LPS O-acetylase OafA/YrhL